MATLTVSIPDEVLARLRLEAELRGFDSPEDLLLDLVDEGLKEPADSEANHQLLKDELLRRVRSDDWVVMDSEDFRSIRDEVEAELLKRQKA